MTTAHSRLIAPLLLIATALALNGCGIDRVDAAQAKPSIIEQMNAASKSFVSAQADLRQEIFTKALKDTETQTGQIYFLHKGGTTQMGMKMLPPEAKPGTPPAQIFEFKDNKLQALNTGTSQVDVFPATTGKNQATAEIVMTLGFGGSGTDLQKAWTITDQGPETLTDGKPVQTEKLDLVSKDQNIRDTWSHITVWVDPARDVSLKQTFFEASGGKPTGDTRTVYYSNIRLNQNVDTTPFTIKCKGKCNTVLH